MRGVIESVTLVDITATKIESLAQFLLATPSTLQSWSPTALASPVSCPYRYQEPLPARGTTSTGASTSRPAQLGDDRLLLGIVAA